MICVLILAFAARYRRKSTVDRSNPPPSSQMLEIIWIGGPLLLGLVMFTWGATSSTGCTTRLGMLSKSTWSASNGCGTCSIPRDEPRSTSCTSRLGRPIKLTMTSQDVIHSFFIPAFRMKQDVLPGRYTTMWFEPTKIGRYHLFCAEYCGTNHSDHGRLGLRHGAGRVSAMALPGGDGPSMAEQGERLFVQYHCAGCHRGSQTVHAPRLEGVYGRPVPIQQGKEVRFTRPTIATSATRSCGPSPRSWPDTSR